MIKLKPEQIQHGGGGGHEVSDLAEEPLVIDSNQKGIQFSLTLWPQVVVICSSGWARPMHLRIYRQH